MPRINLSNLRRLFTKLAAHAKRPAILLSVPGVASGVLRIKPHPTKPDALTVLDARKGSKVFGRVDAASDWIGETGFSESETVGGALSVLDAQPADTAAAFGRLHHTCCFCGRALTDDRSTAAGYGRDCAAALNLPWGKD